MKSGDSVEMNRMFRARIYAQAFTLVALVAGGMYFKTERQQRREFDQAVELRKKQEKRDAWLRELEIRDKEDREWRERHASIEAAAKEVGNKPAPPKEPEAARSSIEPADEKSIGIMDAVRALISRDWWHALCKIGEILFLFFCTYASKFSKGVWIFNWWIMLF